MSLVNQINERRGNIKGLLVYKRSARYSLEMPVLTTIPPASSSNYNYKDAPKYLEEFCNQLSTNNIDLDASMKLSVGLLKNFDSNKHLGVKLHWIDVNNEMLKQLASKVFDLPSFVSKVLDVEIDFEADKYYIFPMENKPSRYIKLNRKDFEKFVAILFSGSAEMSIELIRI